MPVKVGGSSNYASPCRFDYVSTDTMCVMSLVGGSSNYASPCRFDYVSTDTMCVMSLTRLLSLSTNKRCHYVTAPNQLSWQPFSVQFVTFDIRNLRILSQKSSTCETLQQTT